MRRVAVALPLLFWMTLAAADAQSPAAAGAGASLRKTMAQAESAMMAGRPKEALSLYDQVLASRSKEAARYEADALYGVALSLLTPDRTAADTERARIAVYRLVHATPPYEHHQEVSALLAVADDFTTLKRNFDVQAQSLLNATAAVNVANTEIVALRQQVQDLTGRLGSVATEVTSTKGETDRLRQEIGYLRAENRAIREDLAKTQADLAKKDAALRKIAGSIVNKPVK
jgi:hypothetical protein